MRQTLQTRIEDIKQAAWSDGLDKREKFFSLLNFTIPCLMGLYVFVNPLSMASLQEFAYYLSILALIILLIFRKTPFTLRLPLTVPLALFAVWALAGLFFTLDFANTLHDLRGYLLEYLIVFYLLINFYNARHRLEWLASLVIVSSVIFSIVGFILFYCIEGHAFNIRFGLTFKEMYTGFMCFTTVFAAILSLRALNHTPSLVYRVAYFASFVILVVVTLLNQSRGALLGLAAGLVIMCVDRKKNLIFVAMALLLLFSLPGVSDRVSTLTFTKDIRTNMFRLSWEVIKDYPVFGVGYGGEIYSNQELVKLDEYNAHLPEEYQQHPFVVTSPHSTPLDVAIRTGLVGLALFGLIFLTAIWMLGDIYWRRRDEFFRSWAICLFAGLASYGIQSVFVDSLFGTQAVMMYVNLAMVGIVWRLARR